MGSTSSKFRKHLQNGDEVAALHLYNNNSDLRKALDASSSYGDSHQHETPLHLAAQHGMKSLLRIFLNEHGGNPNKTNSRNETALHCVCLEKNAQFYMVKRRRLDCLVIVLAWRGSVLKEGGVECTERVDLSTQDMLKNTALHNAAACGLLGCVELLVQSSAPLFVENNDGQTPCDSAEKTEHGKIALYLESKMVFSNDESHDDFEEIETPVIMNEDYSGLRAQDLQEAKDQLLVETADMLNIPLFTAEALLRNHEWSREMLLEAWMADALICCENSGVTPPASLYCDKPQTVELSTPTSPMATEVQFFSDLCCEICMCMFPESDECVRISCDHQFCRSCWMQYLTLKIQEGEAHNITCPAFDCTRLVPVEIIEGVVSREVARKYLQFDIQAFVERNPSIKWCPYPSCGNAVRLPDMEVTASPTVKSASHIPSDSSRAVNCGNGHLFCWECLGEAHEPCSCENWKRWCDKVAEVKPETLHGTDSETELAANCLWLVTNSKPCPNCKSPIQKNEGCNHMKCSKCKHDFCWVCLEQWKRHNSSTGGYFKCNRYEAVTKVREANNAALTEAELNNNRLQELNRFVHYYTRFKNHENSYKLEEPLICTARDKMMKLAEAVTDVATANEETKFVENAVTQLLSARRILRFSYVYGYYLDGPGYKKIVFEFMQTELEEATEILSQMVNRLYLRTPRKKIIDQAARVQRKRREFISAIAQGLVPAETPPSLRKKHRRKYSMDSDDDEMRQAILASINDFDANNPWIKDASGRHTNVMAVLDWPGPDDSDEEEEESSSVAGPSKEQGTCVRSVCTRPRAKNPRTGTSHEHCSLRCLRMDNLDKTDETTGGDENSDVLLDEHMDFLRAMEMSRLQFLQDSGVLTSSDASNPRSITREDLELFIFGASHRSDPSENGADATKSDPGMDNLMHKLDVELERVLSSLQPREVDPEVKQALAANRGLSLPGTPANCPSPSIHPTHSLQALNQVDTSDNTTPRGGALKTSQSDETCSTGRGHASSSDDLIGAVGGFDPGDTRSVPGVSGNAFGVIKDIDVANIHAADIDKIGDFSLKDMRGLTGEKAAKNNKSYSIKMAWPDKMSVESKGGAKSRGGKKASAVKTGEEGSAGREGRENVRSLSGLVEDYLKSCAGERQNDEARLDVFTGDWLRHTLDILDTETLDEHSGLDPSVPDGAVINKDCNSALSGATTSLALSPSLSASRSNPTDGNIPENEQQFVSDSIFV